MFFKFAQSTQIKKLRDWFATTSSRNDNTTSIPMCSNTGQQPGQFALVNSEDALYCGNKFLANPKVVVVVVVSRKKKRIYYNFWYPQNLLHKERENKTYCSKWNLVINSNFSVLGIIETINQTYTNFLYELSNDET